jgi:tRNA threonylcarbamoyladenosine dehydratase
VPARFHGIERLYGAGTLEILQRTHVAVVGIGGVGSWAAESLVRSGIGAITLIDADDICSSNINRQLHALESTVGQSKTAVMAQRLRQISPRCNVHVVESFLTPSNQAELLRGFDYVLDACDSFRVKLELVVYCKRQKIPLIVSGAAGGRTDPTLVRVRDLSRTEHDALLSLIRRKLRTEFKFPSNKDRYFGIPAVYSLENVKYPQADGSVCERRPQLAAGESFKLDCGEGLGAASFVTGTFAFVAVAELVRRVRAKAQTTV